MEAAKIKFKKIKKEQVNLRKEIKERTVGYILAAFGFVVGLAWNEAIKSAIDQFFPNSGNGILIKFIYAFLMTIIIVLITIYLLRVNQDKDIIR